MSAFKYPVSLGGVSTHTISASDSAEELSSNDAAPKQKAAEEFQIKVDLLVILMRYILKYCYVKGDEETKQAESNQDPMEAASEESRG